MGELEDDEEYDEGGGNDMPEEKPPIIGEPLPTGTLGEYSHWDYEVNLLTRCAPMFVNSLGKASYVAYICSFPFSLC